ncbi:MAG: hypothetical protein V3U54_08930 [Thermodesulfobacteriota bacterium]
MYRITEEIADYLLSRAKDPGFKNDTMNPFKAKHLNTIGVIDPMGCFGSDFAYSIEHDFPIQDGVVDHQPEVAGYWLYKQDELKRAEEPTEIPRHIVDSTIKDIKVMMDITDCCITVPDSIAKQMCKHPRTMDSLLKLEPQLKKCLETE